MPRPHATRLLPGLLCIAASSGFAQAPSVVADSSGKLSPTQAVAAQPPTAWYQRLSLRGYSQIRYNRLFESNRNLVCAQCDRSIGNNGGIFLRRGRLVVSGDVSSRVSIYIQPDFASDAAGQPHLLQLRDAYFDLYLDAPKQHRLRVGQSKVPFGFEDLQSSVNRAALDRNDATNSAVPNERDIGVFYYWTPDAIRRRFRILTDSGLKGTGDYGVFGVGVYNGQSANRPEANNSLHAAARLAYPWRLPNGQFIEGSLQGYRGRFVLISRTTGVAAAPEFTDERLAVALTLFPQPFGLQGEWTWGHGPEYVHSARAVEERPLKGGYLQAMYRIKTAGQVVTPFARMQYYGGGKKAEQDARSHDVHEVEAGLEWLPFPSFELTAAFAQSNRLLVDGALPMGALPPREKGHLLRLQAQFNY